MWALAGLSVILAFSGALVASVSGLQSSDDPADVFVSPDVIVHSAPPALELRQRGTVTMKAGAPAAPGDRVYLNTAGAQGAGYVPSVSECAYERNCITRTQRIERREVPTPRRGDFELSRAASAFRQRVECLRVNARESLALRFYPPFELWQTWDAEPVEERSTVARNGVLERAFCDRFFIRPYVDGDDVRVESQR